METDVGRLKILVQYIGDVTLDQINMDLLEEKFISLRINEIKTRTMNHYLKIVSQILKLAAGKWRNDLVVSCSSY